MIRREVGVPQRGRNDSMPEQSLSEGSGVESRLAVQRKPGKGCYDLFQRGFFEG